MGLTVEQMVAALEEHLAEVARTQKYPLDDDGDPLTPIDENWGEFSPAAGEARAIVRRLLAAAEAKGLGGCRLCRG